MQLVLLDQNGPQIRYAEKKWLKKCFHHAYVGPNVHNFRVNLFKDTINI